MKSLSDIYISDNLKVEQVGDDIYYPFVLIFPNKKRIYFCRNIKDKLMWINSIKKSVGFCNIDDYYEICEIIGRGKYGVVRKGVHKRTKQEVAVKIVQKKDVSL